MVDQGGQVLGRHRGAALFTIGQRSGLGQLAAPGPWFVRAVDTGHNRVRKVSPVGVMTTIAGNGTCCYSGDGGIATAAQLNQPWGLAVDRHGNLFIADAANHRIRKRTPEGRMTTVAGAGTPGYSRLVERVWQIAAGIAMALTAAAFVQMFLWLTAAK